MSLADETVIYQDRAGGPENVGFVRSTLSARLFKNIESYPGQLFFTPQLMSAKSEVKIARADAVRGARQAERTNAHIRSGIDTKTDMVVGPRLFVQPTPDWDILTGFTAEQQKTFVNQCLAWFNNWAYDTNFCADAAQHLDFGGLMHLAYRGVAGPDAECLGIIHFDLARMAENGFNWATCIELINPDQLETPPLLAGDPNRNIFEGKELDAKGAWVRLHIRKKHISEGGSDPNDYLEVPRRTPSGRPIGFHYFEKTRPEAQRGLTNLVTVLRVADQLDKRDDASLGAAILDSIYSMYAKTLGDAETLKEALAPAGEDNLSPFERKLDFYKSAKIRIGGNRIAVLPPGDELVMTAVDRASQDPTSFVNLHLRKIAAATDTTFAQLAKNFSDDNYSAARAAILDIWRSVVSKRTRFNSAVPSPIYSAVIEEGIARKRIVLPAGAPPFQEYRFAYTRCAWTGPAMPEVDPYKAAQAMEIRLRTRTSNRQMECANSGVFYYDVFKQFGVEVEEAQECGFELEPALPGVQASATDTAAGGSAGANDPGATSTEGDQTPAQQRRGKAKE